MNNFRRIYENLRQRNPNSNEHDLRRQAWVINDRQMFEATSLSPSSADAGAGSGGGRLPIPTKFTLKLKVDVGDGFGLIKIPFDYVKNYTIDTVFTYHLFQSADVTIDVTIGWNSDENRWELITGGDINAISYTSPYEGWISYAPEESDITDIFFEFGNVTKRCFKTEISYSIVNPLEVVNFVTGQILFYFLPFGFIAHDPFEDTWYLLISGEGGETPYLLGGTYDNFPYGTFTFDEFDVTLTNGFCPL